MTADPDLARVIDAWPDLPAHIRAAVLALADAALLAKEARFTPAPFQGPVK